MTEQAKKIAEPQRQQISPHLEGQQRDKQQEEIPAQEKQAETIQRLEDPVEEHATTSKQNSSNAHKGKRPVVEQILSETGSSDLEADIPPSVALFENI